MSKVTNQTKQSSPEAAAKAPKKSAKPKIWQTKYGPRRVKEALPTLEEALFAAKGLSDDFNEQIEIASSLLGVPQEQVRAEAMKSKHTTTLQVRAPLGDRSTAGTRSVVVERRVVRRSIAPRRIGV